MIRVQDSFLVDVLRITVHVILSLTFFVYDLMVLSNEEAMCDEIKGTSLYYWCYVTYYLLLFRIINFCLALVTLCIHRVNEGPMDDAGWNTSSVDSLFAVCTYLSNVLSFNSFFGIVQISRSRP